MGAIKAASFFILNILIVFVISCTREPRDSYGAKPVVIVNSYSLSAKEFGDLLIERLKGYDALSVKQSETINRIKGDIISDFIHFSLISDFAKSTGLVVSEETLRVAVNQVRKSYPDEISFRSALAEEQLSYEMWEARLKKSLLEKTVYNFVVKSVPNPTEQEAQSYFNQNKPQFNQPAKIRLRQIVLEKEEDAQKVHERILHGGNIEKLAREMSVGPEAINGGDTGWITKGTLSIFDNAFNRSVGYRSDVLKSSYGYHIYEVLGKKPASQLSFAEVKDRIRNTLKASKEMERYKQWLDEQARTAKVSRNEGLISSIKVHTEN